MSTDIKPGQVWQWNDEIFPDTQFTIDPDIELGEYAALVAAVYPSGYSAHYKPESILTGAHLVKDVDATPAPLDPSKVHVGDTVTVRFIPTGDMFTTKAYQPEDVTKPGEWVYILGWPLNKPMGHGLGITYFEILAIEPAPEPESEWVGGEVAIVKFDDMSGQHRAVYKHGECRGGIWELLAGGHDAYADETTVVRPLAVVDPERARALVHDHFDDDRSRALLDALLDGAS